MTIEPNSEPVATDLTQVSESVLDTGDAADPDLLNYYVEALANAPSTSQIMFRTEEGGVETILSFHSITFLPNQKTEVVHLPFSPRLPHLPSVNGVLIGNIAGRIRVTDCQVYGARIEVILGRIPTEPVSTMLRLQVISAPLSDEGLSRD